MLGVAEARHLKHWYYPMCTAKLVRSSARSSRQRPSDAGSQVGSQLPNGDLATRVDVRKTDVQREAGPLMAQPLAPHLAGIQAVRTTNVRRHTRDGRRFLPPVSRTTKP